MTIEMFQIRLDILERRLEKDRYFDQEEYHKEVDDLMVEALTDLGYNLTSYENHHKWYC